MRLPQSAGGGHLTYCTNIHAGERLSDVMDALATHLPGIKAAVSPDAPFGLGLRLGAEAAGALDEPGARDALRLRLDEADAYVFTINGFPYGAFHGAPVKEQVYAPDWATPERLAYTDRLARLLAALMPDGIDGSISTVPLTFRPWADGRLDAMTRNLLRHVATLVAIRRDTGRHIALALEPEPCCHLETIEETVGYFEAHLFTDAAARTLAGISALSPAQARDAIRAHLGVCYDVCHAAVEYEDAAGSLEALRGAGVAIPKLQLSSALRVAEVDATTAGRLAPFDEPTYLHQVIERRDGALRRHLDLPEALARAGEAAGAEWRVHFHVPVYRAETTGFETTQGFLKEILALHRRQPISAHLEVETYTWDVLPEAERAVGLGPAIARELAWVKRELGA